MSKISPASVKVGIGINPAANWGTAADLTTTSGAILARASTVSYTCSDNVILPEGVGQSSFVSTVKKTSRSANFTMSLDLLYNEPSIGIALAALLGSETASGVEATLGEGDYVHTMKMACDSNVDLTVAWLAHEDDRVMEVPSVRVQTVTVDATNVDRATITIEGIASNIVGNDDAVNSGTVINALPASTDYSLAVLGTDNCATHYFRLGDRSETVSLSGANDLAITNVNFSLTRPLETDYTLRACQSRFTDRPTQVGKVTGTVSVTLGSVDHTKIDSFSEWDANAHKMAELNMDGPTINAGDPAGFKFQWPHLMFDADAPVLGLEGIETKMQPVLNFIVCDNGDTGYVSAGMAATSGSNFATIITDNSDDNFGSPTA
jgi:hypothetical protein